MFSFKIFIDYTVHVMLRHLVYLHFRTRKAILDTLLVMLLDKTLNDLLQYVLFVNLCMFYLLFTNFCMFFNVCIHVSLDEYIYIYIYIYIYVCISFIYLSVDICIYMHIYVYQFESHLKMCWIKEK